MANEENLIPFTSDQDREEAKKNGRKGGVASGLARREKATMKKVLLDMLEETNAKGLSYKQLATLGLIKGAIKGNAQNYKTILEAIGEIETNNSTPEVVIKVVDNTDLEKAMYEKEN